MANDTQQEAINKKPIFSIRKFIIASLKSWKLYALCIGALVFLTCAFIYIRKPAYEVDAQLMLPQESSAGGILALSDMASNFSLGDFFGASSSENEIALMKSYTVFMSTVKDLNLNAEMYEKTRPLRWMPTFETSQLSISTLPSIPDTLSVTLKFDITINDNGSISTVVKRKRTTLCKSEHQTLPAVIATPFGDFTIDKTAYFGTSQSKNIRIIYRSYSSAAQGYAKTVSAFIPNKKADVIGLSYTTTDPEFGKLLLQTVIDNYNLLCNEQKNDRGNNTLDFVDSRLSTLEQQLAETETSMETFKKKNRIVEPEYDAAALIKKADEIEAQLLMAQTQHEIISITRDFIADPENKYSLIPSIGQSSATGAGADNAVSDIGAYNQLILERMKLVNSAKPNNAALQILNSQIDAMRQNVIASVDRAYQNSTVALNKLVKENQSTINRMGEIPSLEREYITLERNFRIQQQLYLFLLKQKEEANMSVSKIQPSLVTVDPPYVLSESPGLSNFMLLFIAMFLGFAIAAVFVFTKKLGTASCDSAKEIDTLSDAPVLGVLPLTDSSLPVAERVGGDAIRMLRANIEETVDSNQLTSPAVLVTSIHEGEGKSYVAANLAASYAMMGLRTLLIGADYHGAGLSEIIGAESGATLAESITDTARAEISEVTVGNTTLSYLPAGNPGNANPADLLCWPSLSRLMETYKKYYERIIIDAACLQGHSDAFAFASLSDITLFVAKLGDTTSDDIFAINNLYADGKFSRIAIVVNGMKA